MNQIQSIIVYRNPIEAAFWEGGYAVPAFIFMIVFMLVIVSLSKVRDVVYSKMRWRNVYGGYFDIAVSLVAAFFVMSKVIA